MGQSTMVTRLALEQPVRVQFEILLNQGLYFEYTQLLPGAVLIQLILGARGTRAHEIKQIPTGIAGLIDMVKKTSSGLVSFHLVLISRRTRSSKLGFFRLRFQHSEGTKSQK